MEGGDVEVGAGNDHEGRFPFPQVAGEGETGMEMEMGLGMEWMEMGPSGGRWRGWRRW